MYPKIQDNYIKRPSHCYGNEPTLFLVWLNTNNAVAIINSHMDKTINCLLTIWKRTNAKSLRKWTPTLYFLTIYNVLEWELHWMIALCLFLLNPSKLLTLKLNWSLTIGNVARFRKKFSTLCSLLNWLHHPLVLESGEFLQEAFSAGSVRCWIQHPQRVLNFSRLCRVLNVSEGAEFSSPSVLLANHRVAYKKFWSEGEECLWNSFLLTLVQARVLKMHKGWWIQHPM